MRENIGVFQSQYMLNPTGESIPTFPIELLQSQTIKCADIPVDANSTYAIWDLAYSIGPRSDSSVGVTASQAPDGRVYVREVIHDKFLPEDLALAIVDCYLRYRHKIVIIEASLGAENLRPTIERIARSQGVEHIPLFFLKTQTRRKNAKLGRIAALEPLLRSGRLFFSDDIACLSELYEQFSYFGSASHDDIPDAIALLFDSGYVSQQPYRLEGESLRRTRLIEDVMRDKDLYDRYFGPNHGDVPMPDQPVEPEWNNPIDDPFAIPGMPQMRR